MKFKATIIEAFDNNLKFASDNEEEQYERIIESASLKSAALRFCSLAGVDYFLSRPKTSKSYVYMDLYFQNGIVCETIRSDFDNASYIKEKCNENISSKDNYIIVELYPIYQIEGENENPKEYKEAKCVYKLEKIQ